MVIEGSEIVFGGVGWTWQLKCWMSKPFDPQPYIQNCFDIKGDYRTPSSGGGFIDRWIIKEHLS